MSSLDDKLKGNWDQLKGKVKQQWGDLTDDDLTYADGKSDELLGKIQEKTGEAKEKVAEFFDSLFGDDDKK
ncbi:CsbD family protein [Weeksellaceae bacterium TAE3-ERU29]|nr:CsbD family protein [Weeksellaceae bacterium TAE3-ERU29]